jgi:hypothetical protein
MNEARPVWMLRINPMVRGRLADADLARLLQQAATLEQATGPLAAAASDDLYGLVRATPEATRGSLLALRRDIHNDRVPPGPMGDAVGVELPPSVLRWAEHHDQRLTCQAEIRRTYDEALVQERSMLRKRLGEGNFLTTLAQSAPGVYAAACRYRAHHEVDSKDRKAERALVQYLTRALVRTSPYGRFTAVALAEPDGAGVAMDQATPITASPQVDIDRALFGYVMGGLVPANADTDPWLSLPPTARVSEGRITFFQMGPEALRRLSAPLNPPTRLLVELLDLGPCPRSALAAALSDRLGLEAAAADRLLGLALGLGLLVTAWRGDEFVAEPVEKALRDLAATGVDPVLEGLRQFRAELDRLGDAVPATSASAGDRLAAGGRLQTIGDELSRLARRPAKLAVSEDYILDPLVVDPGPHQGAFDDLAAVTGLLWAFDRMHVVRALVAATMAERFGPGCQVPLVEHAEMLVREAYRAEHVLAEQPEATVGPADGSLAMLAKVRREALTALHQDLRDPDDLRWSPDDLAALVAGVPDRFRIHPASYGMVVQLHQGQLIVNDTYAGHGPMVSRFLHADQVRGGDGAARLRGRLQALYGPGVRLLEDRGHHNLSINMHPRILDECLDAKDWQSLRLAHDRHTDTVSIVDADGAPVKVLALGAQLPELFPYPVRLATWLCSSGRVVLDAPGTFHRTVAATGEQTGTVAYPRLQVGRVVVSRRRWYPGADFPAGSGSGSAVDQLLAVTRWRGRHGVPAEVMLKSAFDGPTSWESLSGAESRDTFFELRSRSKPQYVDLASALMTRVLPRLLERRPGGFVEEALPGLADAGYAQEWMIEVARPAGHRRFDWRSGIPMAEEAP